jgi:predicted ester cyclase
MQFRTAIPDLYLKIEHMVAEGDKVLTRWESGGTQSGPLASARGTIPPTGKKAVVRGFTLNRLEDGRIIDAWDNFDIMGMLQQLGVIPSGGPPA